MMTGNDTRKVEKIARKITSRPGNLRRASANPAIEWNQRATTVMVPATKKLLSMYRQNGRAVKTYWKFSSVQCNGRILGLKVSSPGLNEAETIQTRGLTVKIAKTAVNKKSKTGLKRRNVFRGGCTASEWT